MILIWLALALGPACFVLIALDWPKWHGLAQRAVETKGLITAKEPSNHMSIRYSYEVRDRTYFDIGQAGGANPEFEKLKVGDSITVFYDPQAPEVSSLERADKASSSIAAAALFVILLAPIVGFVGLHQKGWLPRSQRARS